jgi:hypothetical protein
MHLALVPVRGRESDVAGVCNAVVAEAKVVIVFGRIDLHAVAQASQHMGENRDWVIDRKRAWLERLDDLELVEFEARKRMLRPLPLRERDANACRQARCDEHGSHEGHSFGNSSPICR